ncbi:hypothetical protein V1525DRAFT_403769 [Lipomyces kononenkoae]|uniref:Uncharacterized protein n=1 Tax=Lipomyces kononenkoae TaxID=34357 RepID=A0ACC3T0V4_LIPKO
MHNLVAISIWLASAARMVLAGCGDTLLWKGDSHSSYCENDNEEYNFGAEWYGDGIESSLAIYSALFIHDNTGQTRSTTFFGELEYTGDYIGIAPGEISPGTCIDFTIWAGFATALSLLGIPSNGISSRSISNSTTFIHRETRKYNSPYVRGEKPRYLARYDANEGAFVVNDYADERDKLQPRAGISGVNPQGRIYASANDVKLRVVTATQGRTQDVPSLVDRDIETIANEICERWTHAGYSPNFNSRIETTVTLYDGYNMPFTIFIPAGVSREWCPPTLVYSATYDMLKWAVNNLATWGYFGFEDLNNVAQVGVVVGS